MTQYWIVEFGAYKFGIETAGSQPDAPYFSNWLREFVAQGRVDGNAQTASQQIATELGRRWPGRAYFVEVRRADRLGVARIESDQPVREIKH